MTSHLQYLKIHSTKIFTPSKQTLKKNPEKKKVRGGKGVNPLQSLEAPSPHP